MPRPDLFRAPAPEITDENLTVPAPTTSEPAEAPSVMPRLAGKVKLPEVRNEPPSKVMAEASKDDGTRPKAESAETDSEPAVTLVRPL